MHLFTTSFLLLLVRHLLLEAMHLFVVANSVPSSDALVTTSFLLLLVRHFVTSSEALVSSSKARSP